jgi:hypothetical protein
VRRVNSLQAWRTYSYGLGWSMTELCCSGTGNCSRLGSTGGLIFSPSLMQRWRRLRGDRTGFCGLEAGG